MLSCGRWSHKEWNAKIMPLIELGIIKCIKRFPIVAPQVFNGIIEEYSYRYACIAYIPEDKKEPYVDVELANVIPMLPLDFSELENLYDDD